MSAIDQRLKDLEISLPEPVAPVANYVPFVISGNQVFISGQISMTPDGLLTGKLGDDIDLEAGIAAARACGLNLISQLKAACGGDLDRVVRVVKLGGFVNSTQTFYDQPVVINAASDLMVDVFGDKGRHARAAVSAPALPLNAAVEIDGVFEIS